MTARMRRISPQTIGSILALCLLLLSTVSAEGETKASVQNLEGAENARPERGVQEIIEIVPQENLGQTEQQNNDPTKPMTRAKRWGGYGYNGGYGMGGYGSGGMGGYGMSGYNMGGGYGMGGYGGGKTIIIKKIFIPGGGNPYYG